MRDGGYPVNKNYVLLANILTLNGRITSEDVHWQLVIESYTLHHFIRKLTTPFILEIEIIKNIICFMEI